MATKNGENRAPMSESTAEELLERLNALTRSMAQLNENQNRASELAQKTDDGLTQLEGAMIERFSIIANDLVRLSDEIGKSQAPLQELLQGISDSIESLSAKVLLLQARMENLEFRLISLHHPQVSSRKET